MEPGLPADLAAAMNPGTHKPLCIGHRGGGGDAPENTLLSMEMGIALGVDYIETDIQLTADGHLVVMHDKRVDRTTGDHGRVTELTLAQLRALDAGRGQRIPLLSEVLDLVNGRTGLMAEIITPGIADRVVAEVRRHELKTPVLYASFHHSELLAVRERDAQAQTLALLEGVLVTGSQFAKAARATHVGLGFDSVTEGFVHQLQDDGLLVFVYTLDHPDDIARAWAMGVDGIISNHPERVFHG
jgi:glycerophosphoryl diester phosphodiesterase